MLYWKRINGPERKLNLSFDFISIIATKIYPAILVVFFFGLTIFIHELGHFLVARKRGMVVERFYIGFGRAIFSWKHNGVEYGVGWLPFGGYVALPQMSPMDTIEGKTENSAAELPVASPSSKILVAIAGPLMNICLAFLLATILWQVGLAKPVNPSFVGYVEPGSNEETLGIQRGDRIVKINGQDVKTWMDVQRMVALGLEPTVTVTFERKGEQFQKTLETEVNPAFGIKTINLYSQGRPFAAGFLDDSAAEKGGMKAGDKFVSVAGYPVTSAEELREKVGVRAGMLTDIKVLRDGQVVTLHITPALDPKEKVGRIGVKLDEDIPYEVQRPGPTPFSQFHDVLSLMGDTVSALIHSKQTGIGAKSLSGPVGIAGGWWYEISHGGWTRGLWYAVLLNINLAIINLLPLPVLDGGHIVFSILEAIRRKPLNARFIHAASVTFAVLLISFMLYVTFFDIQRLTGGHLHLGKSPVTTNESGSNIESK
jgi:regulator of sigma E protease